MERYPMLMNWHNQFCEMTIVPKHIYMFNAIPIKILMTVITENEKSILNLFGRTKDREEPRQ
jgi:hypothetical protein